LSGSDKFSHTWIHGRMRACHWHVVGIEVFVTNLAMESRRGR
jgi:hypothetical protein